ncbi:MAG: adenosine kinase [Gammaproteobacteria bacterium]
MTNSSSNPQSRPHITGLGNALCDLEFKGSKIILKELNLEPGDTLLASQNEQQNRRKTLEEAFGTPHLCSGGSVANSLVVAACAPVDCTLVSMVGADSEGSNYRNDLGQAGVELVTSTEAVAQTGNCLAVITGDGQRTMSTYLGCNEEISPQLTQTPDARSTIANSDWLILEGYLLANKDSMSAMEDAQKWALQHQTKIALTLSSALIAKNEYKSLERLLENGVDLVIGNESEACAACDCEDPQTALALLTKFSPQVAITLSERGALLATSNKVWHYQTEPVVAIDSLGAGDAFAGGLLTALALGHSLEEAAKWGCAAGATCVQNWGARLSEGEKSKLLTQWGI